MQVLARWVAPTRLVGARHGLRAKIMRVVALTTTAALLLSGVTTFLRDLGQYRRSQMTELSTEAEILGLATGPMLAFDDRAAARRTLLALRARSVVLVAALYDNRGALFAHYGQPGQLAPARLSLADAAELRIIGGQIQLIRPIVENNERLGTLYLAARYDVLSSIRDYAGILALVTALSLLVALVWSTLLQQALTAPLVSMAAVARQVVERRDFSLRAPKETDDEVGVVVEAFNSMLDEVQAQTRAVEQFNAALRASEARFRATFDNAAVGVANVAVDGRFVIVNDRLCAILGYSRAELLQVSFADITHPEDVQADWSKARELLDGKIPTYSMEKRYRRKDGTFVWANLTVSLVAHETNSPGYFVAIIEDIDLRKQAEAALLERERRLRDADQRKDIFIATLAHELRNPLAPLRVSARLLGNPALTAAQLENTRGIIARQVQHMALLLDDLLDVSRITRGILELKKDVVDLSECISAAVETVRPLLESKQHRFTQNYPSQPVILEGDPVRLTQIIANLLTNAVKYTDPEGTITLTTQAQPKLVTISVRDTGIGLAREVIPRLFEMFSQVQPSGSRTEGGLGIGLALAKGLVELHGGRIEVRSEGLEQGSEFIVYLPRAVERDLIASGTPDEGVIQAARVRRILIADDNRDAADSLALFLRLAGHEVVLAYSGPEALDTALRMRPDVLILDIGMPGMTGYEVARRVRQYSWAASAVLIAVTGWGQEEDQRQAHISGFDHHRTKPIDPAAIQALLRDIDTRTGMTV